jgi:hypothetical protein
LILVLAGQVVPPLTVALVWVVIIREEKHPELPVVESVVEISVGHLVSQAALEPPGAVALPRGLAQWCLSELIEQIRFLQKTGLEKTRLWLFSVS